ncbi:MAG: hypothetical protein GC205_12975 [Bacteroidetes bacterium]|nr:hypothetical protein [Bacteroidota bacterium]
MWTACNIFVPILYRITLSVYDLRLFYPLLFTCLFWGSSCGPGNQSSAPTLPKRPLELPDPGENVLGLQVYKTHCKLCHGLDGQMGGSGAANLAMSLLTEEEAHTVVAKGRNLMAAYENKLSPEELNAVVQYIQLFKAN